MKGRGDQATPGGVVRNLTMGGGGAQQSLGLKNPLKSLVSLATPINYLNYEGWRTYRSVW